MERIGFLKIEFFDTLKHQWAGMFNFNHLLSLTLNVVRLIIFIKS